MKSLSKVSVKYVIPKYTELKFCYYFIGFIPVNTVGKNILEFSNMYIRWLTKSNWFSTKKK
jgi:hypothetical protein